jgi:hypothetical protein
MGLVRLGLRLQRVQVVRIDGALRRTLDESGVPWRVEQRRRHHMLVLGERTVGVLPRGTGDGGPRRHLNFMAAVRRAIKEMRP